MKTTLLALVLAGCCLSSASAQAIYFGRPCASGVSVRYASGPGCQFSRSSYRPQVVSYGQPWVGGYGGYCAPVVPVRYYCPVVPVVVNPCGQVRSYGYQGYRRAGVPFTYRSVRTTVVNPAFPAWYR